MTLVKKDLNNDEINFTKTKNCTLNYKNKQNLANLINNIKDCHLRTISCKSLLQDNLLLTGDNLVVMKKLLKKYESKIDLVYIDPPFGTGRDFKHFGNLAYTDTVINDEFLEFLRQRIFLIHKLLSEKGSFYLHIDKQISHYVKIILDEIFGSKNFINEITRIKCNPKNFDRKAYGNITDVIFYYAKNRNKQIFNNIKKTMTEQEIAKSYSKKNKNGRAYTTHPLHAPGETINGDTGVEWMGMLPKKGRHWRHSPEFLTELQEKGLIEWSKSGNPRKIVYADEHKGKKIQDLWEFKDKGMSYVSYPTEKNHEMLQQIIKNSSNENSIVLDCFCGSGSTAINSYLLNRKFITIDISPKSINTTINNFEKNKIMYKHCEVIL